MPHRTEHLADETRRVNRGFGEDCRNCAQWTASQSFYMKVQHIKPLKGLSTTKEPPEMEWANSRKLPKDALRTLNFFCRHCGLTPTQLLDLQTTARRSDDPDAELAVLDLLKKCIGSIEGRKGTKVNFISTIRSFFDFHHRPLPVDKTWIRTIKSEKTNLRSEGSNPAPALSAPLETLPLGLTT
jgi:hypothetical protein